MSKVQRIEINFPVPVEVPSGFENLLAAAVDMVCKQYEVQNPYRVMWPAGQGSKILSMPMTRAEEEAGQGMEFDDLCYEISVSEREAYDKDLKRRGFQLTEQDCPTCGSVLFRPTASMEPNAVTCANNHVFEEGEGRPRLRIHFLLSGKTICGEMRGVPAEWPKDHKWTDKDDQVTCPRCRALINSLRQTGGNQP